MRGDIMTYYIEKCTKEIMTGLELDKRPDTDTLATKLVIQRILHRNIDELFKVLLESQKKNEV
jgi:hypothetical protein|tara:strand:- start:322 stop:510 length:189 start_codon:yes stop_codon:yes gene_type:complete